MSKLFFIFLIPLFICSTLPHELPSYIPICKRNNPEFSKCMINAVNTIRPYLIKGIPELELPPGDPLQYHDIESSSNCGGLHAKGKLWNQTVYGLMDFEFKAIDMDLDNVKTKTEAFFPKLRFAGKYTVKGKVLLFELDNTGDFQINTTTLNSNVEFTGRYYTKKSKQYIEYYQVDVKLDIKETKIYFDNVVKGHPVLTKILNDAINENIAGILSDIRSVIEEALGAILQLYFNRVFGLYPVDTLFPVE